MDQSKSLTPHPEKDYEAIEAAVMETERGRWFLREFARRNRTADTEMLLGALKKLETSVHSPGPGAAAGGNDKFRFDIMEMAAAIAQAKREIAAIKAEDGAENSRIVAATEELDAIVAAAETATSDILEAAEHIQESAWTLREHGASEAECDKIDEHVTGIYTSCSFQDMTGQRIEKVVNVMRFLELRLDAMLKILDQSEPGSPSRQSALRSSAGFDNDRRADAHLLNGPQLAGRGLEQDDVDLVIADAEDEEIIAVDAPLGEEAGETSQAESDVMRLGKDDRQALFATV